MTIHTFTLEAHTGIGVSSLTWDDQTGELTGPLADDVRALLLDGSTPCHPFAWGYTFHAGDRTTSAEVLAAVLGWEWRLPDWLAGHYPQMPPEFDVPDGVVA